MVEGSAVQHRLGAGTPVPPTGPNPPPERIPIECVETSESFLIKVKPSSYMSAQPEILDELAIISRKRNASPLEIGHDLRRVYRDLWGREGEITEAILAEAIKLSTKGVAVIKDVVDSIKFGIEQAPGPLSKAGSAVFGTVLAPLMFRWYGENRRDNTERTFKNATRAIAEADPYWTMTNALMMPMRGGPSSYHYHEFREVVPDHPKTQSKKEISLQQFINAEKRKMIERTDKEAGYNIDETLDILRKATPGVTPIFSRAEAIIRILKKHLKVGGYANIDFESSTDTDLLPAILRFYRKAFAYISSGGKNIFPILDHWYHLKLGLGTKYKIGVIVEALAEDVSAIGSLRDIVLVPGDGFDRTVARIKVTQSLQRERATQLFREALGPPISMVIDQRGQFPEDAEFPLGPFSIIFRNGRGGFDNIHSALNSVIKQKRIKLEANKDKTSLEYLQEEAELKIGINYLLIIDRIHELFSKLSPAQRERMFPALPSGETTAASTLSEMQMALEETRGQGGKAVTAMETIYNAPLQIPLSEASSNVIAEQYAATVREEQASVSETLDTYHTISYAVMGSEGVMNIPGNKILATLQDKRAPLELKAKVASLALRKLVGFPPDLEKFPHILGTLSADEEAAIRALRSSLTNDKPYEDMISDPNFSIALAQKLIRTRLKSVHSDLAVQRDEVDPRSGELTRVYTGLLQYLDEVKNLKKGATHLEDL